jgi:hypothetical protein
MKQTYHKYKICFLLFLLATGIGACNKDLNLLDVPPKGTLTDEFTFSSEGNADLFVYDIYNQLPEMQGETQLSDQYTDNSATGASWESGQSYLRAGSLGPTAAPNDDARHGPAKMWDWEQNYTNIRKCNIFLANVDKYKENFSPEWINQRVAEVKFLRGLFYTFLYTNFGGLPLIDTVLNDRVMGDNIFFPRSSIPETITFIESDLDAAAGALDLQPTQWGRATKGAALAVKGWVDLFSASKIVNQTNDPVAWAKAAASNKAVMDLNYYDLFQDNGLGYYTQFLGKNNWNIETIFARMYAAPAKAGTREGRQGPVNVNGANVAWGNIAPTQSLVDDYAMDNGKPIFDPGSGYDPQHPYVNRERRFYQSIVYDGSPWQGDVITTRIGGNNAIDLGSNGDITNTAYYGRKTVDESIDGQSSFGAAPKSSANYIFFRYAEVLLSYAEAQNEAVGPDPSVYEAVNKIRERGNIADLPPGLTQDQMRTYIRRERRIELAFEDKRWFDIRRWDITAGPTGVLNLPTFGMVITGTPPNLVYTPTNVWNNNKFFEWQNWVPIPQVDIDKNPKLVQNPGYN